MNRMQRRGDRASDRVVDKENIDDILVKGMGDVRKEIIEEEKAKPEETYGQAFSRSIRNFVSDPGGSLSRTWRHVKEEASHYWLGSKLLWREMKMAKSIIFRLLEGNAITRREATIDTNFPRYISTGAICVICIDSLHGILTPSSSEIVSKYVTFDVFDQTKEGGKYEEGIASTSGGCIISPGNFGGVGEEEEGSSSDATSANATEVLDFMEKARKGEPLPNSQV